jgi:(E)-4-hydroxy-3-methyl-but-2-enyl pyrophosphate reductase
MATGKIILAEEMGYCWGVRRALDIIQEAADPRRPVATIGDVIHNPQVVARLHERGVHTATSIEEAARRGFQRVAITAHGAGPFMHDEARQWGVELIDTTCPLVTKVQRMAQKLAKQGYTVVVYGDAFHPEVKGVMSWSGTARIFPAKKLADLPWTHPRGAKEEGATTPPRKVAVVSQTTKNTDEFLRWGDPHQQHDLRADLRAAERAEAAGQPGRPDPGRRWQEVEQHGTAGRGGAADGGGEPPHRERRRHRGCLAGGRHQRRHHRWRLHPR